MFVGIGEAASRLRCHNFVSFFSFTNTTISALFQEKSPTILSY